ncbi:protein HIGH ARSENIC CONTENT 1, mitochondrial-like isoform X2 [Rutidosis leptorrhynchoides]|uniref:protein HIGH ARSENIC CONTENT 1, mitochondrial-like isoform X2 n=1 Tax=Rutidosis leptorrhynchoides TaxID=125765 RepID=UPI003A9A3660
MFNTPEGRVKNPNFMEQVLPVCTKDDHLIVGFKHVYNMGGGYLAWVQNELPVTPNETSNVATGSASPTVSLPKPINNAKMI